MDDNQGGGVGAFAEEEANKKRQKKEDSVSTIEANGLHYSISWIASFCYTIHNLFNYWLNVNIIKSFPKKPFW